MVKSEVKEDVRVFVRNLGEVEEEKVEKDGNCAGISRQTAFIDFQTLFLA